MPFGPIAAALLACIAFIAYGRRWRDRFWVLWGFILLVGLAVAVGRNGVDTGRLIAGPTSGAMTLGVLLFAALFGPEAVGLPRRVAIHIGIGFRNRAGVFDRRMWEVRETWYAAIRRAQEVPDQRVAALVAAAAEVRRLRSLRAPNHVWAELRNDIASDDEDWIALIRAEAPAERFQDHIEAFAPVARRWEELRTSYRADSATVEGPGFRRRHAIVSRLVMAAGGLLLAYAMVRALLLP